MQRARLFIVEDEVIVAEDLGKILARMGYEVAGLALDGKEALKQAPLVKPDLVLMDIFLGKGPSGISTACKLRHEHGLPVVFLTAYADDDTIARARVAEPFGYVLKPFNEAGLKATLEMALNRVRLERHLRHLNGILWTIRGVNRHIAHEKEADKLAEKVCRLLVDGRGYQNAWILLLDSRARPGKIIAASRKDDTLLLSQLSPAAAFPACVPEALREKRILTFDHNELCQPCVLAEKQVKCAFIGRLAHEGKVYGVLGVAVPREYLKDPEEVSLFEGLRDDLGAAFHALALEEENRQAFAALQKSEAKYRSLLEHLNLGVVLLSREMEILSLNRQMQLWFPHLDAAGTPRCYEIIPEPPQKEPCPSCPVVKTLADGHVHEAVQEIFRGGCRRIYRLVATPLKDQAGQVLKIIYMVDDITAQAEAARKVKESEEKYRLLLSTIPSVVYSGYVDGSVDFFDDKVESLTGYSAEEFNRRQRKWPEVVHPEDLPGFKAAFRRALKGEKFFVREYRLRKKGGGFLWVQDRGRILCSPEGRVRQVIGVLSDISATKAAEQKIQEQTAFLQTLIDTMPNPVFYKDVQGLYLGCNKAFEDFTGLPREQILGKTVYDVWPPDLAAIYARKDQELFNHPGIQIYETLLPHRDGSSHEVILNKATFLCPDGRVGGLVGVVVDISEQKRIQAELHLAKEEMEQLLASLNSILIGLSPAGKITHWNPAATQILGVAASEALGRNLTEMELPLDEDKVLQAIRTCLQTKESFRLPDMPFVRTDGSRGFLGLSVSPIRSEAGEVAGFLLTGADITERRILESQLAQAQKLEAIGQLAAGIAHEINTPIQFVSDNTHFLEGAFRDLMDFLGKVEEGLKVLAAGQDPGPILENLKAAATAADLDYLKSEIPLAIAQSLEGLNRVTKIVRAMKDFSHPGSEDLVAIDLNKALENTITVSRNEWKYVAEMHTDFDPALPLVSCFPQELNQVFLNIIVNAAQAIKEKLDGNPPAKKSITVSTRRVGDWAEIRISDTGPGIPENIRHRVFEPFFTTKEVGKGTGQGLAICHAVVTERHKGTITFESEEGVGTTFIIRLPIAGPERKNHGGQEAPNPVCG